MEQQSWQKCALRKLFRTELFTGETARSGIHVHDRHATMFSGDNRKDGSNSIKRAKTVRKVRQKARNDRKMVCNPTDDLGVRGILSKIIVQVA
jgi:hypothetical protein